MKIREFELERYYARHEFSTPLQLSASDCEALTVEQVLQLGNADPAELLGLRLGYTETQGAPALREAIAAFYPDRAAAEVLVFNAPQEAIFLAMHAMLEPGDRVIVMTPCYPSLKEVARSIGAEVLEWPVLEGENGWSLDLEALEALIQQPAKLLVTNAPHNPTGLVPTSEEWRHLAEVVSTHEMRWFSDEMYRGLEPAAGLALPPAACVMPGALSLWGMSKSFGLPGLRIGRLVAQDTELLGRIEGLKDYTTICSNAAAEVLARVALTASDEILGRNRALITANADRMDAFVERHHARLSWHRPMAGPVGLARLAGESAAAHAECVRTDGPALLVPGTMFDLSDEQLRIGLGRANFPQALDAWEAALP